jgi:hypothetical protein
VTGGTAAALADDDDDDADDAGAGDLSLIEAAVSTTYTVERT